MADKTIGTLPKAAGVYDDTLLPAEQQGAAVSISGAVLKKYAREAVSGTAQEAAAEATKAAAAEAVKAAKSAETAREYGEDAVERSMAALAQSTQAQQAASAAITTAENAGDDAAAALDAATAAQRLADGLGEDLSAKVDGAYVENGYLYLTSGDEVVAGPLGPFSGTGGGGSGGTSGYLVSLKNLLPSRVLTVSGEGAVELQIQYASADEDGNDDGPGVGTLTVNGAKAATLSVAQGNGAVDVAPYLTPGTNTVKLRVENSEGLSRTLSYTITVVSLTLSTTFDSMGRYEGPVIFSYTVTGTGTKTVHFLMDGAEIGTEEVSSSGRSRSWPVPVQADGAHVLEVYAEVTVSGTTVRSNTISVGMLYTSAAMSACAVLSTFARQEAAQGEILQIPYMVYDPQAESAAVTLSIIGPDGAVFASRQLTVDRTAQTWTVQDYPAGAVTFRIACGAASAAHTVTVSESSGAVEPVTDALALHFDPTGRSNFEDDPRTWTDGEVSAVFSGVSFTGGADGWLTDRDGAAVLRILPGGEMSIPFHLFANDARTSGVTVEVEMAIGRRRRTKR